VNCHSAPPERGNVLSSVIRVLPGQPASGDDGRDTAARRASSPRRLDLDQDGLRNGLAKLVLMLVKLLHDLLERQAIRRVDSGTLSDAEIERLGTTLRQQAEEIERMRLVFGLEEEDLHIDLGPLGQLG
jgi:Gas vesicle protein K